MSETNIRISVPDDLDDIPEVTLAPLELEAVSKDAVIPYRAPIGLHWQKNDDRIDAVIRQIRESRSQSSSRAIRTVVIICSTIAASMCVYCGGGLFRAVNNAENGALVKENDDLRKQLERAMENMEKEKKLREEMGKRPQKIFALQLQPQPPVAKEEGIDVHVRRFIEALEVDPQKQQNAIDNMIRDLKKQNDALKIEERDPQIERAFQRMEKQLQEEGRIGKKN